VQNHAEQKQQLRVGGIKVQQRPAQRFGVGVTAGVVRGKRELKSLLKGIHPVGGQSILTDGGNENLFTKIRAI
jgi:hypothetical protein